MSQLVVNSEERPINKLCFSDSDLRNLATRICSGHVPVEVLRRKRSHVITMRVLSSQAGSIVAKFWQRHGVRGAVRRLTRTNGGAREWRALVRLHSRGVSVPIPLGRCTIASNVGGYTDAVFTEDLGSCVRAGEHIKALVVAGRESELRVLEDRLIELTAMIADAGVLDVDHGLTNILVTTSHRLVRVDLEQASVVAHRGLRPGLYGAMLGRCIGTYAFSVQPEAHRIEQFAQRLAQELRPSRRVRRRATAHVMEMMELQRREQGIDTRVELRW